MADYLSLGPPNIAGVVSTEMLVTEERGLCVREATVASSRSSAGRSSEDADSEAVRPEWY